MRCMDKAEPGRSYCKKHLEVVRKKSRSDYWKARKEGRCFACGKPELSGNARCDACAKKDGAYHDKKRKERREQGLCIYCGDPAIPFRDRCALCAARANRLRFGTQTPAQLAKLREYHKDLRDRWRANGQCVRCGRPLDKNGADGAYRQCHLCRDYKRVSAFNLTPLGCRIEAARKKLIEEGFRV